MGDFEAPSFSLGFDFHFGTSEPQIVPNITSNRDSADVPLASDVKTFVDGNDDDDDEFEIETLNVADSELQMMMKTMRCCSRMSFSKTLHFSSDPSSITSLGIMLLLTLMLMVFIHYYFYSMPSSSNSSEPKIMVSASTSSMQNSFKYDVFLSFRGEDTRKNFVDHLYHALMDKGIYTYKDDEKIQKGKRISDDVFKSIEDSKFYIHEKEDAAGKWREALKKAADLAGFELESIANGHEAKFIQEIIEKISIQLNFINSSSHGNLIGMETRVKEVISSLEPGIGDARMLGIWGMGGVGKTTLARAIFDQISIQFDGESFIENVREVSKASLEGLKKLQKQVLSDVLKDKNIDVSSVSGGKSMMQRRMRGIKVLVVLDDVDNQDQLEALAGDWFKPGSRVIITTRDKQVLVAHGVRLIHNVNLLSHAEAGCLFSRYAFGRENPIQGYEELSGKVLQYADGLPLTIKVMGSHLRGLDESEWKDAIKRLERIPFKDTMKVLELSYDGLEEDCKQIFLDVACILKAQYKEDAIRVLESCGFYGTYGLKVLEQKSLITYDKHGNLWMHDHLEEMGRNIVRRSRPDEPERHSRLWVKEEIEYILTNDLGTPATKYLRFWEPGFSAEIAIKGLAKMKDLKALHIWSDNSIKWKFDKVSEYLPSSLRFMRWWGFPFSRLPNTFQGKHLVGLELYDSKIVQLWEDGEEKVLHKLRFFTVKYSKLRTFDLRLAPNLESLTIISCKDFVELHIPADHCLKLEHLDLSSSKLTNLHLGNFPNLKTLKLCGHDLVGFQMPTKILKLEHLDLSHSKLKTIHLGS
ncbi:Toll/interleukin-1 receptor domain-containing protein, partial [Tanacetum coccineum]